MYVLNGDVYIPTEEERKLLEDGDELIFINWEDQFDWTPIEEEENEKS